MERDLTMSIVEREQLDAHGDPADVGNEHAAAALEASIAAVRASAGQRMEPNGVCRNCEEPAEHPLIFCCHECRDDFEHRQRVTRALNGQ
jgi:hypothetical protein